MKKTEYELSYHDRVADKSIGVVTTHHWDTGFSYAFHNFFHPFVGRLIERLNKKSPTTSSIPNRRSSSNTAQMGLPRRLLPHKRNRNPILSPPRISRSQHSTKPLKKKPKKPTRNTKSNQQKKASGQKNTAIQNNSTLDKKRKNPKTHNRRLNPKHWTCNLQDNISTPPLHLARLRALN